MIENESNQGKERTKGKQKTDKSPVLLDKETMKTLKKLSARANKKDKGRKITNSQLIHEGIQLISDAIIKGLQENSLSEKDRLEMKHLEYCKEHGKVDFFKWLYKQQITASDSNG